MKVSAKVVIILVALGVVVGVGLLLRRGRATPPVVVTLQIRVTPPEQVEFVAAQANSARFKYLAGKQAGVQPSLAQKLTLKVIPGSPVFEATAGLQSREEAQRFVAGFIEPLQAVCGNQAQVTLAGQTIH